MKRGLPLRPNELWVAALLTGLVPVATAQGMPRAGSYECLIEPSQVVELRSTAEGLIAAVHVKRGDAVRRGQVLVELQSRAERVAVEAARFRAHMEGQIVSARNRIDYATKKAARADELAREKMVSAQVRDEAEAELRLAESELKAALENRDLARIEHTRAVEQLALRTLTSPFNGVVLDRMLNPGDLAESGTGRKPVLKLAQIDPLKVDVVMPAAALGKVHPGARVTVVPQGLGGRYVGVVRQVDKVVDTASGTLVARVELANRDGSIPSGVRCTAEFEVPPLRAPLPPARQAP